MSNLAKLTDTELHAEFLRVWNLDISLSAWHNRRMSKKDREFFHGEYVRQLRNIEAEIEARELVAQIFA